MANSKAVAKAIKSLPFTDNHHWRGKKPDPRNSFGFIYLVTNTLTGQMYIGKKQYYFTRLVQGKSGKKRTRIIKPSDWEYYTGSSKTLNEDIKKFGVGNFIFEILWNCSSKSILHWMEIREQVLRNVLLERLDGSEIPLYYNRQIAGIKFIPKGDIS